MIKLSEMKYKHVLLIVGGTSNKSIESCKASYKGVDCRFGSAGKY